LRPPRGGRKLLRSQPVSSFVSHHRGAVQFDLQEDPEETRNLAMDGAAKGDLIMALNDKLNARIDQEVGEDNGKFLSMIDGYWYPAKV
jgi:hypothetical protein